MSTSDKLQVVMFTFHAYASWLPDRPQGYYRNKEGLKPSDPEQARIYRLRQVEESAEFDEPVQRVMIQTLIDAASHQQWTCFAIGKDRKHLHMITAWHGDRTPEELQRAMKSSLTQALNRAFGRRVWFTRNGHKRRVRGRGHFVHLPRRVSALPSRMEVGPPPRVVQVRRRTRSTRCSLAGGMYL